MGGKTTTVPEKGGKTQGQQEKKMILGERLNRKIKRRRLTDVPRVPKGGEKVARFGEEERKEFGGTCTISGGVALLSIKVGS